MRVGNPTPTIFKLVSPKLERLSCIIIVKVVGNEVLKLGNVGRRPMVDVLLGYNIWNCMRTEFKQSKSNQQVIFLTCLSPSPRPLTIHSPHNDQQDVHINKSDHGQHPQLQICQWTFLSFRVRAKAPTRC